MNCDQYRELISARSDGEITDKELVDLERHLRSCPECGSFARELADLGSAMEKRHPARLPGKNERRILSLTIGSNKQAETLSPGFLRGYYRVPRGLVWAAVFALAVLIVIQIFGPFSGDSMRRAPIPEENPPVQHIVLSQNDIVYTYRFREASENSNGGY